MFRCLVTARSVISFVNIWPNEPRTVPKVLNMAHHEGKLVRQRSEPILEHLKISNDGECVDSNSLDGNRINITFTVINQNDDHFKRSFNHAYTVADVKRKLSKLLKTKAENLALFKDNSPIADDFRISSFDGDDIEIDIFTKDDSFIDVDIVKEKFNESISVIVQDEPPKKIIPANITCKFHVFNQDYFFTKSFLSSVSVLNVKQVLSGILGVDKDILLLFKNRSIIENDAILSSLDFDNFGNLELELFTKDGSKMNIETVYKDVPIADILTVAIPVGLNKIINVNVEVIDARIVKPYLGGYRNKINGLEYHHAFTQTLNNRSKVPPERKNHRDTQTIHTRDKSMGTGTSRGTQMQKPATHLPLLTDVILIPRPYRAYAPREMKFSEEEAALKIQRCWRAHRCRKHVDRWLIQCRQRIQVAKEEEMEEIRLRDIQVQKEIKARTFPRTKDDFDQLYSMVDRWRNTEIARISKMHPKGPKVAEFCLLLDKEIQLLRSIEKFRIDLAEDFKSIKEKRLLNELSKPATWHDAKGNLITMDTMEAQQVRKFKDFYVKFCDESMSMEQRMELLVNFKFVLKDYKSPLAGQLTSLIDRECELLVRNVPAKSLDVLRKRIRSTVFQFVKFSEFNPEIRNKHKSKVAERMKDGRLFHCRQCDTVKMYREFPLHSRTEKLQVCTLCTSNNFADQNWVDLTPYKFILRAVRREERKYNSCSSIGYVIQERDIYFIVDKIWHSRSIVSEATDLIDLRLCRWDVNRDWSPWNCVLLTFKEMKAHVKLLEPAKVYDAELVSKVRNKHLLARIHFKHLSDICERIEEGSV